MITYVHQFRLKGYSNLGNPEANVKIAADEKLRLRQMFNESQRDGNEITFLGKKGETWEYRELKYIGRVLTTRERNYYDDSDFYAIIISKTGKLFTEEYATTRFGGGGSADSDATPEAIVAAEIALFGMVKEDLERANESQCFTPKAGRRVKVVKGKKYPIGLTGTVIWYGEGKRFGYYGGVSMRCHVEIDSSQDGGSIWIDARNLEVISPDDYKFTDAFLTERAWKVAKSHAWTAMFGPTPGIVIL